MSVLWRHAIHQELHQILMLFLLHHQLHLHLLHALPHHSHLWTQVGDMCLSPCFGAWDVILCSLPDTLIMSLSAVLFARWSKNDGICILRFPYSCFLLQIPQFSPPVLSPSPSPSGPRVNPISWWTVKVRTQFTQPPRYITRNRSITTSKSSVMAAHHCTTKKTNPSMSHSELPKN